MIENNSYINIAIILSAGKGARVGNNTPKQYLTYHERPIIAHSIETFANHPHITYILPVIGADDHDDFTRALDSINDHSKILPYVIGGDTRQQSVLNGLNAIEAYHPDYVYIHDAARPMVSQTLISRLYDHLQHNPQDDGVFPALAMRDTIHQHNTNHCTALLNRDTLCAAQTPQYFHYTKIHDAHQHQRNHANANHSDDVSIALQDNLTIGICDGDLQNIKITYQEDLMTQQTATPQFRIGQGFDVHRYDVGDRMVLGGFSFPYHCKLKGHSDADVVLHALCDAIYGALAAGDIGHFFPPSDPQWKNANSDIFLNHAIALCHEQNWRIANMDITIICEQPKITPIRHDIIASLSQLTGYPQDAISVKATTTEGLGFTGREEGIATIANIMLYRP